MFTKTLTLFAAGLVLAASPAVAVEIVNDDQVAHEVTVDDGQQARTLTIGAGQVIKDLCSRCLISINAEDKQVGGTQVVTIRDGSFMARVDATND